MPLNEITYLGKDNQVEISDVSGMAGQLNIPNEASWTPDTLEQYAVEAIISSDGTASDPANLTTVGGVLIQNAGNATGMADVDDDAVMFHFSGWVPGTGTEHAISGTRLAELPAGTHGARAKITYANGTIVTGFIPIVPIAEWN